MLNRNPSKGIKKKIKDEWKTENLIKKTIDVLFFVYNVLTRHETQDKI